ncbi:hypothetical protein Bca101_006998 [Brassica carinata]
MEDDDRSFATETLDEALLKKHHDMLQRFSARHHARKSDSHHSSSSSTFESTSSFLSRFADSKRSIESRIASSSSDDSAKIKSDLAEISSSIDDLENLVAANSYFLPIGSQTESRHPLRSLTPEEEVLFEDQIVFSHHRKDPKTRFRFASSVYAGPVIAVESDSRRTVWIEEDLKTAGLEEETESRANVDDFLWLRA